MKFIIFNFLFLLCITSYGQKYDSHWMIGYIDVQPTTNPLWKINNIDFNTPIPTVTRENRTISIGFGGGSASDKFGALQFYTNGFELRNRNDQAMPNGLGLNPGIIADNYNTYGKCYPTTHGPIFLPNLNVDSTYHMFHCGWDLDTINGAHCNFLYYSTIDMRLQNGMGDVIDKNHPLLNGYMVGGGGLGACKHANGRDWWLIMQELESNCFYSCLLTPNGVDSIGKQCIGDTIHWSQDRGSNVFTPDGSKYIWSSPYFEHLNILDFDRCTGAFSNHRNYNTIDSFVRGTSSVLLDGVAVSPNSKYLYLATGTELRQFDLQADSIETSEIIIDNTLQGSPQTSVMFCQLAPDGKIYICPNATDTFLHIINYPDSEGLGCGFVRNAMELPSWNTYSLPYYPNYRLGPLTGSECDTLPSVGIDGPVTSKAEIILRIIPNPSSEYMILDYGNVDWNKGEAILEIYDATGRKLLEAQLPQYSTLRKIETSNWNKGVYWIMIKQHDENIGIAKWIKN